MREVSVLYVLNGFWLRCRVFDTTTNVVLYLADGTCHRHRDRLTVPNELVEKFIIPLLERLHVFTSFLELVIGV